jgi:hypothetical protein
MGSHPAKHNVGVRPLRSPGVGGTSTISVSIIPKSPGSIVNHARVAGAISDPLLQNNTALVATLVQSLALSAQIPTHSRSGNTVRLGLQLTHVGTGAAQGISINKFPVRALGDAGTVTY